jgi:hypothetical protein
LPLCPWTPAAPYYSGGGSPRAEERFTTTTRRTRRRERTICADPIGASEGFLFFIVSVVSFG